MRAYLLVFGLLLTMPLFAGHGTCNTDGTGCDEMPPLADALETGLPPAKKRPVHQTGSETFFTLPLTFRNSNKETKCLAVVLKKDTDATLEEECSGNSKKQEIEGKELSDLCNIRLALPPSCAKAGADDKAALEFPSSGGTAENGKLVMPPGSFAITSVGDRKETKELKIAIACRHAKAMKPAGVSEKALQKDDTFTFRSGTEENIIGVGKINRTPEGKDQVTLEEAARTQLGNLKEGEQVPIFTSPSDGPGKFLGFAKKMDKTIELPAESERKALHGQSQPLKFVATRNLTADPAKDSPARQIQKSADGKTLTWGKNGANVMIEGSQAYYVSGEKRYDVTKDLKAYYERAKDKSGKVNFVNVNEASKEQSTKFIDSNTSSTPPVVPPPPVGQQQPSEKAHDPNMVAMVGTACVACHTGPTGDSTAPATGGALLNDLVGLGLSGATNTINGMQAKTGGKKFISEETKASLLAYVKSRNP
jgi:mono/diheme cytochrome c family protein